MNHAHLNHPCTTENVFVSFPVFCLWNYSLQQHIYSQDKACNKYEHEEHTNALGDLTTCIILFAGAWVLITLMGPNQAETVLKREPST